MLDILQNASWAVSSQADLSSAPAATACLHTLFTRMSSDDEAPEAVSFAGAKRQSQRAGGAGGGLAGSKRPRAPQHVPLKIDAVPLPAEVLATLHIPGMAPPSATGEGASKRARLEAEDEGEEEDANEEEEEARRKAARKAAAKKRAAMAAAERAKLPKVVVK